MQNKLKCIMRREEKTTGIQYFVMSDGSSVKFKVLPKDKLYVGLAKEVEYFLNINIKNPDVIPSVQNDFVSVNLIEEDINTPLCSFSITKNKSQFNYRDIDGEVQTQIFNTQDLKNYKTLKFNTLKDMPMHSYCKSIKTSLFLKEPADTSTAILQTYNINECSFNQISDEEIITYIDGNTFIITPEYKLELNLALAYSDTINVNGRKSRIYLSSIGLYLLYDGKFFTLPRCKLFKHCKTGECCILIGNVLQKMIVKDNMLCLDKFEYFKINLDYCIS